MDRAIPNHVGIIMDGNGRWAKQRGLARAKGHSEGLKATKAMVAHAASLGIKALSLYTFSTENWSRAADEVGSLMNLIATHLRAQMPFYKEHNIRILHSGSKERLSSFILKELEAIELETASHNGLLLNLLIDYGAKDEIIRATKRILISGGEVSEQAIEKHLDQPLLPMIDCVIRTAGEQRLSNFMIWQAAYAEFISCETLWPDFNSGDFDRALEQYYQRKRTFGGV